MRPGGERNPGVRDVDETSTDVAADEWREVLEDLTTWSLDDVATAVAQAHGVPLRELLGRRRHASVARARAALYTALRGHGMSYPEIGRLLRRDHTTVMSVVRNAGGPPSRRLRIEVA